MRATLAREARNWRASRSTSGFVLSRSLDAEHADYPEALRALGDAAPTLYVRGALPSVPLVAIVGTRSPSMEAKRFARELARDLSLSGFAIVSGGARGIDAEAHEGALEVKGATVMVAGGGLDRPYPPEHAALFDRIVAGGGALVARVPDGAPPTRPGFLLRNVVLAGLAKATIVVEAGLVSGARSAAAAARRFGRLVAAVPHAPWDERGAGCLAEIGLGACSVARVEEALALLSGESPPRFVRPRVRVRSRTRARASEGATLALDAAGLDPDARAILLAVPEKRPMHIDEIAEITGLPYRTVVAALLTLTLRAVVVEAPAGLYQRALVR
jgi:DNA processing protein